MPSLQVRLRLGLAVELFQGRVAMDTCMDVSEFHHVFEVDHKRTAFLEEPSCYQIFRHEVAYNKRKVCGTSSCCVLGGRGGSGVAITFPHFPVE